MKHLISSVMDLNVFNAIVLCQERVSENKCMPLNRNAYLAGALLLIVGLLPHRVR